MYERRVFERIEVPIEIKYEVLENSPGAKDVTSKDISGGGIRIILGENLTVGTPLKLYIPIPGKQDKTTVAYGKIVWIIKKTKAGDKKSANNYEAGVQFNGIDPVILGKIFQYFSVKK